MRTIHEGGLRAMLGEMVRARELTERAEYEEARTALLKLRAQCSRVGVRSAHVAWGLAIASDGLGEFEQALSFAREALELDPLAVPYQRSYELIVTRLRDALADDARPPDDPSIPRLYDLLLRAGEGDARSHLVMARFRLHRGEHAEARRILEAVTTLTPAFRDAWRFLAVAARGAGDDAAASRAEIEAAALEGHDPSLVVGQTARS